MRRSSTRKTGPTNPTGSANSMPTDVFRSASSKAIIKELERIDQLFYSYADKSSGMIDGLCASEVLPNSLTPSYSGRGGSLGVLRHNIYYIWSPEGIESLCSDVGVDHTDVRILMLAWKMKAEKQGYFTLEEWRRGLKALRADTINKLKKALPELEKEVRKTQNFLDFYSYAFRYCLTEEKQKSIDIESICELLNLVLGSQYQVQVNSFIEYLKAQNDYKVINMDQWTGFLRFCNEINFPTFDNYDPDHAWPLILDNYVEWMREKQR